MCQLLRCYINRERLNEISAHRRADPRRGLPVNDIVAALANPAFRDGQAASSVAAPSTFYNSNVHSPYQSNQSPANLPPGQSPPPQFPYRTESPKPNGVPRPPVGPQATRDSTQ